MNASSSVRVAGLSLALLTAACGPLPPGQEYLDPELRARVEELKNEVASEPSTPDTVKERARVLWHWANAYSLEGGVIPVELPLVVAVTLSYEADMPISLDPLVMVDRLVRELELQEECPDCIGTLANDAAAPLEAGSFDTLVQSYAVGSMGMKQGGGIMLAKHFMSNHGEFQRDDPSADNYLTLTCSNPQARFLDDSFPLGGMHGGFTSAVRSTTVFRLEGAELEDGDVITITYGDTSGGSKGLLVPTYANDFFPLPVYVDLEATDNFFTLPIRPYQVRGTEAFSVHGFAPSVVAVGESFDLSVRTEDRYYNRATVGVPSYEVLLDGAPFGTLPADPDGLVVMEDLSFDEPGVYRFSFRSPDGSVTGQANPVSVRRDPQQKIYWGELHAHGGFAEGLGTPEWFFRFAREDARLDFVSLSEHDVWMDDSEWQTLIESVERHSDRDMIVFLGYEWSMRFPQGGHHNVFFRNPEGRRRVGVQRAPNLPELYRQLRNENELDDVLIIPHCHQPGDWRLNDPVMEKLVEIMSMHGNFEWFGQRYLNQGHEVGFIAASDDHLSHPGYTGTLSRSLFQRGGLAGVIAKEKTPDAIFDALRDLSGYATTGQRILLDVSLNGSPMGSRIEFAEERRLQAEVVGTSPIDSITVVRNGEDLWNRDYLTVPRPTTGRVLVSFASPSDSIFRDAPRGYRIWRGTLEVRGADLVGFDTPQFANRFAEFATRVPDHPNRIAFATGTRGKASSILLELEDISSDATVVVDLEPATEMPSTPQKFRSLAKLPPAHVVLPFRNAIRGRLRRDFQVDRYTDSITLRFVDPGAAMEQTFEFSDHEPVRPGDYYYVRVRQLDGGMAWSSPIWVGGVPPA
jgi:hypothetical protein